MSLIGEGAWITAAANAGLNLILSLAGVIAGQLLAKTVLSS